jgi:hypothetical protein
MENLSISEIKKKLENYVKVDNIGSVSIGTHLRYFKLEENEYKFRSGGILDKTTGLPDYIVLTNGSASWSVQINNCIFFSKITQNIIQEEFTKKIEEKNRIIRMKEEKIKGLIYLVKKYKYNKI